MRTRPARKPQKLPVNRTKPSPRRPAPAAACGERSAGSPRKPRTPSRPPRQRLRTPSRNPRTRPRARVACTSSRADPPSSSPGSRPSWKPARSNSSARTPHYPALGMTPPRRSRLRWTSSVCASAWTRWRRLRTRAWRLANRFVRRWCRTRTEPRSTTSCSSRGRSSTSTTAPRRHPGRPPGCPPRPRSRKWSIRWSRRRLRCGKGASTRCWRLRPRLRRRWRNARRMPSRRSAAPRARTRTCPPRPGSVYWTRRTSSWVRCAASARDESRRSSSSSCRISKRRSRGRTARSPRAGPWRRAPVTCARRSTAR